MIQVDVRMFCNWVRNSQIPALPRGANQTKTDGELTPFGNHLTPCNVPFFDGSLFFCNTFHQKYVFFCKKFRETYCHNLLSVPKKNIKSVHKLLSATRPSPLLITKDAVASMKAGSVIVDLVPQSLSQTFLPGPPGILESSGPPRWETVLCVCVCVCYFQGHKWMQGLCSIQYIYIYYFLGLEERWKRSLKKSVKWYDPLNSKVDI